MDLLDFLAGASRTDALGVMIAEQPTCQRLQDGELQKLLRYHRHGTQRIGLYNLLPGDIVRWAAVDFDSHGKTDALFLATMADISRACQEILAEHGILALREISKSGRGNYHLWIFLAEPVPASYVRRVLGAFVSHVLKRDFPDVQGIEPEVFPKQDALKEGELGNFIWAPLYPPDTRNKRTVFIDGDNKAIEAQIQLTPRGALEGLVSEYGLTLEPEKKGGGTASDYAALLSSDIPEGQRNNELCKVIGHFKAKKLPEPEALAIALNWNRGFSNPRPDEEIERTVASLYRGVLPEPEKVPADSFEPMMGADVARILSLTIKGDDETKVLCFLGALSAFTEDSQINIGFSAPSAAGKSYVATEIAQLFPPEDVLQLSYSSPQAFFHEGGIFDKERNAIILDLRRKIILFLDQPHFELLSRLRPLLSKDKRELISKIVDKSKRGGNRTKTIVMLGFPSVIFCTAFSRLDEQESTRLLLLSPSTAEEKVRAGILEKILRESDPESYRARIESDPERRLLKARIRAIRDEHITDIRLSGAQEIEALFLAADKRPRPRAQRDVARFLSIVKAFALLNLWGRKREGAIIEANADDIREALALWGRIARPTDRGISPHLDQLFEEVIAPLCREKLAGVTRKDVLRKHSQLYGRPLALVQLRQEILPQLESSGLIYQEGAPDDKRTKLIFLAEGA